MIKQPKVYIKSLDVVLPVEVINYHEKIVEVYFNDSADNVLYNFDEVEFIENTGLKDKNGKYIYVGDIVSFKDSHFDGYNFTNFAVMRKNIKLYLENFLCVQSCIKEEMEEMYLEVHDFEEGYFEVVGNIYENKDLLEVR